MNELWKRSSAVSPFLTWVAVALAAGAAASLAGVFLDPRTLMGVPLWLKPFKFFASLGVMNASLLFVLAQVRLSPRATRRLSAAFAAVSIVEMVPIAGQAARGTLSHFNVTTPFDGVAFTVMGVGIAGLQVALFVLAVMAARRAPADSSLLTGLKGGLWVLALGSLLSGVPMIAPLDAPAHIQAAARYGVRTMGGGHAVGAPDDVPGLPVLGWSTQGGDLRAPHFLAIHALQLLPLLGWALARSRLGPRRAIAWTQAVSMGYLGLVAAGTVQALRGQSVVAPDAFTLATFALAVALTLGWGLFPRRAELSVSAPTA